METYSWVSFDVDVSVACLPLHRIFCHLFIFPMRYFMCDISAACVASNLKQIKNDVLLMHHKENFNSNDFVLYLWCCIYIVIMFISYNLWDSILDSQNPIQILDTSLVPVLSFLSSHPLVIGLVLLPHSVAQYDWLNS